METTPNHIAEIRYNWCESTNAADGWETFHSYRVGMGSPKVIEIQEHPAHGEGDKWFYDVHFEDGSMQRIFNPNIVFFEEIELVERPLPF